MNATMCELEPIGANCKMGVCNTLFRLWRTNRFFGLRPQNDRLDFIYYVYSSEKTPDLFYRDELVFAAHIRSEHLGNIYAAVCIEIVFKQGDKHSRRSDNRVVERVGKVFAVFSVYSYLESARLGVA